MAPHFGDLPLEPSILARTHVTRRGFLRLTAAGIGGSLLPAGVRASEAGSRAKVVVVRFGGGVRRIDTIAPDRKSYTPWLVRDLAAQGTLWENVDVEGHTSHAVGSINLLAGSYFPGSPYDPAEQIKPHAPTLLEIARRDLGLHQHEALIVNNHISTEFVGWSDDPLYGADFRPGVLSPTELKRWAIAKQFAKEGLSEHQRDLLHDQLGWVEKFRYRKEDLANDTIRAFWDDVGPYFADRRRHGDDMVFALSVAALEKLRPRILVVQFQDTDYAHWGIPYFYTEGLARIDEYTHRLHQAVRADPFYRDDTFFFAIPDCGRGTDPHSFMPYQHHETGTPGSRDIFMWASGPGIRRGLRIARRHQQIDLAPTIGSLLGLQSSAWGRDRFDEVVST